MMVAMVMLICCCYADQDQAQLAHVVQCLSVATRAGRPLDPEAFQRLILTARSVAITRPANLVKFAERDTPLVYDGEASASSSAATEAIPMIVGKF